MGAILILASPSERAAFGGAGRLMAGVGAELVMAALIAPAHMLSSCRAIVGAVVGRDRGWSAQRRRAEGAIWSEAWRTFGWQTGFGLALAAIAAPYSDLVFWMAPIIVGMTLAAPMAALTATPASGALARRAGIFVTPEEQAPPALLRELSQADEPAIVHAPAPSIIEGRRLA
jgi:membrane glycosyltransferase